MTGLGALAFLNPWLLAGLAALPILWWLLRAIPPSPRLELFSGIRLLLGLEDPERQASRTPWWLLLLRALAIAAIILGFAAPVLNPSDRIAAAGAGPVLVLMDQGWASAPDWEERVILAAAAIDEAGQAGREVVVHTAGSGESTAPIAAGAARALVEGAEAAPWPPDHQRALDALEDGTIARPAQTLWLSDGLAHGEATAALGAALADLAPLRLVRPEAPARALTPPRLEDGAMAADVLRAGAGAETVRVVAMAEAEGGGERRIAVADASFATDEGVGTATFELPADLVGQITRIALADRPSAGGAALADASIRRPQVALVGSGEDAVVAPLTSAEHYLRQALTPWADVASVSLSQAVATDPAAIFLADQGEFTDDDRAALTEWVRAGGLLVRFAGPRLAAAVGERGFGFGLDAAAGDPLLPVELRRGGRVLGGALSWGAPKTLGPFEESGPFRRLEPTGEVEVRTQVLAEPSPDLAGKVWATLDDGTPLVTAAAREEGQVVLFHVSADAEWSSLPLSGLFVEMLRELVALAPGRIADRPSAEELAGTLWRPELLLGPGGAPRLASDLAETVAGEELAEGRAGAGIPPGLYTRADSGERAAGAAETLALNLFQQGDELVPAASPAGAVVETLGGARAVPLGPWLLALALMLLAIDVVATLWITGRLGLGRARGATAAGLALLILAASAGPAPAQSAPGEVRAAAETTLGYVVTGDQEIDRTSEAALRGLGLVLARRTAVEPGPPVGVDPATDPLALYPVLYWPLGERTIPSDEALVRLGEYLQNGGMLIVDTQDGAAGLNSIPASTMRRLARAMNLPPLAPVDGDHVLTRSFYLLDRFPGRWRGGQVWVEAPPPGASAREADPDLPQFDRVDDNVSPVIVGSADWASAWAVDEEGYSLFPVGLPGDQQRELAFRFGVNAVMYALTGNYKSDQVHAPAVLERLGQ